MVELEVLAEDLGACEDYKKPLQLCKIVSEKRYGLGSLLNISCSCGQLNSTSADKSHRSAYARCAS